MHFKPKEESNSEAVDEEGLLCVEQTQIAPENPQEHVIPSLLVEDAKEKQLKSPFLLNPTSQEKYNQLVKGDCFPLCFASFDFLKQRLRVSNQTQKMEVRNDVMAFWEWIMKEVNK